MALFHLKHPASRDFFTWEELAMLCRALGFPTNLFKNNKPDAMDEVEVEATGLSLKAIARMVELQLMYNDLHQTFNHHTNDWNTSVLMRALHMLNHKCLDFESTNYIRVAYATYEHIDMKGMMLDKHTLLRTLKMCGRTISPMKLMHRLKHMKSEFEEKGRIQLYELFNLILWCDLYTQYKTEDNETAEGKEADLFRLVDFDRLLSHHDQRETCRLNAQYLKEEWDFGKETLGGKRMFTDQCVHTEGRVAQAFSDKQNYRGLHNEVGQSMKRLYLATAGSVRSRPISAPDIDKYRLEKEQGRQVTSSAQEAYETVQRRLHSAPSRSSKGGDTTDRSCPNFAPMFTRPALSQFTRSQPPKVVTPSDLTDSRKKMENLQFSINTLDSRCQLQIANEMEFYIPGYHEKWVNKSTESHPQPEPDRKERKWSTSAVNRLAYPTTNLTPSHGKSCDARTLEPLFRGFKGAHTHPGFHVVMTSHTHASEKGRLQAKMEKATRAPVRHLHNDYILRYTAKIKAETPLSHLARKRIIAARNRQMLAAKADDTNSQEEIIDSPGQDSGVPEIDRVTQLKPKVEQMYTKYKVYDETNEKGAQKLQDQQTEDIPNNKKQSFPRRLEESKREKHSSASRAPEAEVNTADDWPEGVPVPTMMHSGPKRVGVGMIGTISLLENIEESRDLEEKFVVSPTKTETAIDIDTISDIDEDEEEGGDNGDDAEEDMDDLRESLDHMQVSTRPTSHTHKCRSGSRKSRSAPHSSSRVSSPKKIASRIGSPGKRVIKKPKPSPRKSKPSSPTKREREYEHNEMNNENRYDAEGYTDSYNDTSINDSSTASPDFKFMGFKGSVTSEEGSVRDFNETERQNSSRLRRHPSQAESSATDEMTLTFQSSDMPEFPESPSWKSKPDLLGESSDSKTIRGALREPRVPVVRLNISLSDSSDISDINPTTRSDGIEHIKVYNDYRDVLSDSEVPKRMFSKETRSRLVNRIENVISPDLRLRLMKGDASIPVSV